MYKVIQLLYPQNPSFYKGCCEFPLSLSEPVFKCPDNPTILYTALNKHMPFKQDCPSIQEELGHISPQDPVRFQVPHQISLSLEYR